MITVHKFPFLITDTFPLDMHKGAEVLHVDMQNNTPCIWAKVDTTQHKEKRFFVITGTGHEIPEHCKYIGTFQQYQGNLIWHLWEAV